MPTIPLRALKTFTGRKGESRRNDLLVQMGDDFLCGDQRRATYLEQRGFAAPLIQPRPQEVAPPSGEMGDPLENKAATTGPLSSPGGAIGEKSGASSLSAPDRVQPSRGSRRPRGERE